MLTPKTPPVNEIVCLRLATGEELLGRLSAESDGTVTISKPILLMLQMTEQGAAITFNPFMLGRADDGDFTVQKSAIAVLPARARDDIRANYMKATTGLDIPTGPGPSGGLIKP